MAYADYWVKPRRQGAMEILQRTASAPILSTYVQSVSEVNPLYSSLRDAAWNQMQLGGSLDPRVLTSLERAREMPLQHKYVIVDAAAARLYMIQDGQIVDSMRVAVGKPGESTQTPMLASTIYYATVNPYWHVSDELIRSLIARNVLSQGLGYLQQQGYQVMPADESDNSILDPRNTWANPAEYDAMAAKLVDLFVENFAQFAEHVDEGVRQCAPKAAQQQAQPSTSQATAA